MLYRNFNLQVYYLINTYLFSSINTYLFSSINICTEMFEMLCKKLILSSSIWRWYN